MTFNGQSISAQIKITINPEYTDEFLEALKPTFDCVTAEPLNTYIELFRDDHKPGVFKLVENWNTSPDYITSVQLKKDYQISFMASIQHMLLKPFEVEMYGRMPQNGWAVMKSDFYTDRG